MRRLALVSRIGDVDAVIFDLDETLIDAQRGLESAHRKVGDLLEAFFRENKVSIERSKLEETIARIDDEMNLKSVYDRNVWWQAIVDQLAQGKKLEPYLVKRITKEYWKTYEKESAPYPDAVPTLEYLKNQGYKLGLLTDDDGIVGRKGRRISRLSFRELFDACVVAGDETSERKPNPLPFILIADRLGASPHRCVMIGDKPFTDIEGGRRAGMLTILLVRRRWRASAQADYEITCLSELRTLL